MEMPTRYYRQTQNVAASDKLFWNLFKEDWIFLFQSDSSMCSHPTFYLKDFFRFDYVGAPWRQYPPHDNEGNGAGYLSSRVYVGNGGFSLRNRTWMIFCLDNFGFAPPEDTFFAYCTERLGRAATTHQAKFFSVEQIPTPEGAIGIHGVCAYNMPHGCDRNWVQNWLTTCPESEFMFPNGKCRQCLG